MKVFLFILLSSFSIVQAQQDFFKVYYPHINEAEKCIFSGKYKEAYQHYQSAFGAVNEPLAKDLYNAAACKLVLKDFDGARPHLFALASRGVQVEILEDKQLFEFDQERWKAFKPLYKQISEDFHRDLPQEVEDKIEEHNFIGKLISLRTRKYSLELSTGRKDTSSHVVFQGKEYSHDFIDEETEKNSNWLVSYARENGVFSERQVGISNRKLVISDFNHPFIWGGGKPFYTLNYQKERLTSFEQNSIMSSKEQRDSLLLKGISVGRLHRDILHVSNYNTGVEVLTLKTEEECELNNKKYLRKFVSSENIHAHLLTDFSSIGPEVAYKHGKNIDFFLLNVKVWQTLDTYETCEDARNFVKNGNLEEILD